MKAVMISIGPKWVHKIVFITDIIMGKPIYLKQIEMRKTRPAINTPFKCFIYCCESKPYWKEIKDLTLYEHAWLGKVIGEFTCDQILKYECSSTGFGELATTCGTCLTYDDILNYSGGQDLYGWHISDLKIYGKPKEISEFKRWNRTEENAPCAHAKWLYPSCNECSSCNLTRPPQSWCYVEDV